MIACSIRAPRYDPSTKSRCMPTMAARVTPHRATSVATRSRSTGRRVVSVALTAALRATPGLEREAAMAWFHAGANGTSSVTRITGRRRRRRDRRRARAGARAAHADDADDPEPLPQPGGGRQLVVGRLADDQHEGALAVTLDQVDHRPQAGAARGLDHRQVLEQGVQVRGARPEARVGAVGGGQAHQVAASAVGRHDAGRGRHRRLERAAVVRGPAHVEHHGRAALPRLLLLADEQLVVPGGRRPVDAAQVVAHHVGAQGVEVVADPAEGVGVLHARPVGRGRW